MIQLHKVLLFCMYTCVRKCFSVGLCVTGFENEYMTVWVKYDIAPCP